MATPDATIIAALAHDPVLLKNYLDLIGGNKSESKSETPTSGIVPTPEIVIPLSDIVVKTNGFSTATDGRGKPKTFDLNVDDVRITKLYINPAWLGGRKKVTITINAE